MIERLGVRRLRAILSFSLIFMALFFIADRRGITSDDTPTDSINELRIAREESQPPRDTWRVKLADASISGSKVATRPNLPPSDTPILVVTGSGNTFGNYYAEILRAEGLNLLTVTDVDGLTPERLASTDMVILTVPRLASEKVHQLATWVSAGGNLIAIKPEGDLLPLLGIGSIGAPVLDSYVLFDRGTEPGRGVVQETLQLRVPANQFEIKSGVAVAHLYKDAIKTLDRPAVTLRGVERGHVAAYAYDLAESVVLTRQGNPAWINQERDGLSPRRANDLFFPDFTDMKNIGIPQADEQQRFFANLIISMSRERRPLPRFWYLPEGRRAAILLASDDHGTKRGTLNSFIKLNAESPRGCRIGSWECYRATSYLSPDTPLNPDDVKRYEALGFEVGVHADTGCTDQTISTVSARISEQVRNYGQRQLGIQKQETHRLHCIPWNGWVDTVRVEREHGIRLSLNYYYWPETWVRGKQGFMTGSGFPMKFADLDGEVLDIYQSATHIVDENGIKYRKSVGTMIDKALGPEQFFGVFGTHYDFRDDFLSTAIQIAKDKGVALISASQALRWVDARNSSRFENISWDGEKLSFDALIDGNADAMTALVPLWASDRRVSAIDCDGKDKIFSTVRIKGIDYASLPLSSGSCNVLYKDQPS